MEIAKAIVDFVQQLLGWWFIVEPWEQAVRVRFGRNLALFPPGLYFRIPFFDVVYKQNVRRRLTSIPLQTLTTADGKIVTLHGSIGYRIADVLKLHQTLHDADASVQQEITGLISRFIAATEKSGCGSAAISAHVTGEMRLERYGLAEAEFFLTSYAADVPTYRIIQDTLWIGASSPLSTQAAAK